MNNFKYLKLYFKNVLEGTLRSGKTFLYKIIYTTSSNVKQKCTFSCNE